MEEDKAKQEIAHLQHMNANYASKIARLEFTVSTLEAELARINAEALAQRRLRRQVKDLYHSLDRAILGRIDRKGYAHKPKRIKQINIELSDDVMRDQQQLLRALHEYDARLYYRLRSPKVAMKLQYRLMSKAYRVTRDKTLAVAMRAYRLKRRAK